MNVTPPFTDRYEVKKGIKLGVWSGLLMLPLNEANYTTLIQYYVPKDMDHIMVWINYK